MHLVGFVVVTAMLVSFISADHIHKYHRYSKPKYKEPKYKEPKYRYVYGVPNIGYGHGILNNGPVVYPPQPPPQVPIYIPGPLVDACKRQYMCGGNGVGYPVRIECVDIFSVCNGIPDCLDGSDERNCPKNCEADNKMTCHNKITCATRCDKIRQCPQGEDEVDCPFTCGPGMYECKGDRRWCISADKICNGEKDCPEYDDEPCGGTCKKGCPNSSYTCSDGSCIPRNKICNGVANDCPDNADELNCPVCQPSCGKSKYTCYDGTCLTPDKVCDKKPDCQSNEDEAFCLPCPKTCGPKKYMCADGSCLDKDEICDGTEDCPDKDDEQDCRFSCTCEPGQYICKGSQACIDADHVCETHVEECEDASMGQPICS